MKRMNDLISRSNLIMRLSDYALQESPNDNESTGEQRISKMIYDAIQNCISCVEEQPTAYDIDKVVEELEERKEEREKQYKTASMEDGSYMLSKCFSEGARAYGNAIKIVKQGGVDDDVCEWKMDNVGASIGCRRDLHHTGYVKRTYCPFCGKKIKVVE